MVNNFLKIVLGSLMSVALPISAETLYLQINDNIIPQLQTAKLSSEEKPIRLHLGCGERYLPGYINIDFPSDNHTVQATQVADAFGDITKLRFPKESIDEVRNHHVFEHFPRPQALALVCAWHEWLKVDGKVQIETPDFDACLKLLTKPKTTYETKQIVMRHIFGSHEAHWAIHCDGWYREKFHHVLDVLGFKNIDFKTIKYKQIPNIAVFAEKKVSLSHEELRSRAKALLKESLVDATEEKLYQVWCTLFDEALDKLLQ